MLLEWWERYRRIILAIGSLLFIGSSLWLYLARPAEQADAAARLPLIPPAYASDDEALASEKGASIATAAPKESNPSQHGGASQEDGERTPAPLFVDVKGSVKQPGLYRLETGMRVADAIAKAGGARPDADLEQINLAAPLSDGTAVVIPAKGSAPALNASAYKPAGAGLPPSSADDGININTATAAQLMTLPGIGEARAEAILRYREEKGGFRSPEELKEIEGIGEKMYDRIKDRLRIR